MHWSGTARSTAADSFRLNHAVPRRTVIYSLGVPVLRRVIFLWESRMSRNGALITQQVATRCEARTSELIKNS